MAVYGNSSGFAAYATTNGYTVPDGDVDAALARGSAYIDALYGPRFPGAPTDGAEQEREWPRTGASDIYGNAIASDATPTRVVSATYEAALLELASPGSLSATLTPDQRKVLTRVDKIEWEVVKGSGSGGMADATPTSTRIEGLLWPLLTAAAYPAIMVV